MLADVAELGQVLEVGEPVTLDDNVAGLLSLVQGRAAKEPERHVVLRRC
jgi:hypothetical protein